MKKLKLKLESNRNTTKVGFQFNHIWSNVLGNECKYIVIETYWLVFTTINLPYIQTTKHTSDLW
jgi:hypothetical protein